VLVYGGRWLERSDLPASRYPRIGTWFGGCLVGFLAFNLALIGVYPAASLYRNLAWGLWAVTSGGAVGLGIGIFEGRAIHTEVRAERNRLRRREAERRSERLEEFAGTVAHDLQNPVHVAAGHLELAREESDSDHLDEVASAVDRMEAMIDRTLALARSGRVISDTEPVDLAATVDRCWDNVDTADATVSVEATATLLADPDRLAHLFENLFRNAVDHAGDDVAVRVGTLDGGFYVADDGPGIPEAERETLLSADRVDTDSGFGLLIVGRIADAHGWAVAVTDSGAGGARFEVTGVEFAEEGRSGTGRGTDKQCRTDSPGGRGPGTGGQ
jgi:signal transduction histidine kinase